MRKWSHSRTSVGAMLSLEQFIYNVAMEYAYTGIPANAPDTLSYIKRVKSVMSNHKISLPDISKIEFLTDFEHWWGEPFDGRYLSIILD